MKWFAVFILCGVSSAPAVEFNHICQSLRTRGSPSYVVKVFNAQYRAQVLTKYLGFQSVVANLQCQPTGRRELADSISFFRCHEPVLRDAGYSLILQSSGYTGLTTATLQAISFAGAEVLAEMQCLSTRETAP